MRLACFSSAQGEGVFAASAQGAWLRLGPRQDLADWLAPAGQARARQRLAEASADVAEPQVWLPPVAPGARIFCVGINYRSHAGETGRDLPPQPSIFIRTQESLVGARAALRMPTASSHFDYEGELAVVIGAAARNLSLDEAMSCVAGYTCFNDGSVRDFQKHSVTAGKNFDASGACGPWIVTADALPDPAACMLVTRLDGMEVQRSSTSLLIYPVPQILSYLSTITQLRPGDIVATGTPAGVGARRDPPLWMRAGNRVEVEIDAIGTLVNPIE
ncbi:MAG: fumarylacetoacetate hydrolase family protein [Burkholderiales bacterium]|nr:fumarylacetoacetate hydrolase family protein [Burkholderiales bacterium]